MICAMISMSTMDATAKLLSSQVDTVMVLWARYLGQTLFVLVLVGPRLRQVVRTRYPKLQFLRSVFVVSATTFFFFGIRSLGLAESTAIVDLNPVLVTLGAALFLGEGIGLRRLLGVLAALVGALIVIRPGSEVFQPASILPLCAAFSFAGYALVTRFVGLDEDVWTSLFYSALFGTLILTVAVPFFWTPPGFAAACGMVLIGGIGLTGQMFLIRAYSAAEAGLIAPFSYVQVLAAAFWGVVLFGDFPDAATWVGMVVIVGSGIYIWHRETRAARDLVAQKARADAEATQF
ncbi:DMT family transporter [Mesobaculum littorinae]|uniref:DMT family transporter n=2 Tax=Mesobaculum littorinae TaxID=2486419 RepID=A0A438AMW8_9RHOB|nr:DMT family transporter [Mesobaculum littorinae]